MEKEQPKKTTGEDLAEKAEVTEAKAETVPSEHEIDSQYAEHDVKLTKDKGGNHLLRFVIILLVVVAILTGGFAIWYFAYYSKADKVAFDAVNHILQAENVALEGTGSIQFSGEAAAESPIKSITINTSAAGKTLPFSSSTQALVYLNQDVIPYSEPLKVSVQDIMLKDGMIYLRISELADTIESLYKFAGEEVDESILALVDLIEGEWWQISLSDILTEMGADDTTAGVYQDMYGCTLGVLQGDSSDEIAKIYKDHQFVNVRPVQYLEEDSATDHIKLAGGYQAYRISLNKAELAAFVNQIPDTDAASEFVACYNNVMERVDGENISLDDVDEIDENDIEWPEELTLSAEISRASHRLRRVYAHYDQDGINVAANFTVKYDVTPASTPENYRPITELFDELSEVLEGMTTLPALN